MASKSASNKPNCAQRKDIAHATLKILDEGFYDKPCPYSGELSLVKKCRLCST